VTERVAFQSEQEGDGVLTSEEALSSGNLQIIGALAGAAVLSGCGGGTETTSAPAPVPVSISDAQASRLLAQATIGYSKSDISVVRSMGIGPWADGLCRRHLPLQSTLMLLRA
jgi:hypothetical protein